MKSSTSVSISIFAMALSILAIVAIALKEDPQPIKLRPVVILSHFYNNELMYRASITNDTMINIGTNHMLKVDFIYGQHDGVKELDNNLR